MIRLFTLLLLCAACGGATSATSACSVPTGAFSFRAMELVRPIDPTCAAMPTAFDVSMAVTADAATGTENGRAFNASRRSDCLMVWNEPDTLHAYALATGHNYLTVARLGSCADVYALVPR